MILNLSIIQANENLLFFTGGQSFLFTQFVVRSFFLLYLSLSLIHSGKSQQLPANLVIIFGNPKINQPGIADMLKPAI